MTPWPIVTALPLDVAIVLPSLLLRGEPIVAATVAPRLATMMLATLDFAAVASVVHAVLWTANRPT